MHTIEHTARTSAGTIIDYNQRLIEAKFNESIKHLIND